jgi:hypothetical protein
MRGSARQWFLDLALVKLEPHDPEKLTHEWHAAHADACACRRIALLETGCFQVSRTGVGAIPNCSQ